MSILAAAPVNPTSLPTVSPETALWITVALAAFTLLAIVLAVWLRIFQPGSVIGPRRLPDRGKAGALLIVLFITLCVWLIAQAAYIAYRQAHWKAAGIEVNPKNMESMLGPYDWAFLSTIPPTLGFAVMLGAGAFCGWLGGLGISFRHFARGIGSGIVGFLILVPAVLWTTIVMQVVYNWIHFQHPNEHVLLKSLGEAENSAAAIYIILGAAVCAPVFEEFLFRGHLQTLVRQMVMRLSPGRVPEGFPVVLPSISLPLSMGEGPVWAIDAPPPHLAVPPPLVLEPRAWHGWVAILITSLLFAALHPGWTWPPIFVLSIGLGYLYERTGNLWATITVHLLFNSLETTQYIMMMRGH